ncbi:MAG: PorV/PorQ family protein [Calditrichales bacterium]|nr:MAG: PorV/PorQ family protein [Calditrichales bacterium]
MSNLMSRKLLSLALGLLTLAIYSSDVALAQVGEFSTDVSRRGTSAAAMLEISVGARAEALGGAFVAIADDPSALYWNPAGMMNISKLSFQATKTDWFVGTSFNALDLVVPLPTMSSAIGFHLAVLDYGENPVRTIFRPEGTGEVYSASDLVAGLYWAMDITESFSVGLGLKYFSQQIWHVSGSTLAGDLAILFKTPIAGLRLGGTISNIGPDFNLTGRDLTRVADVDGRKDEYYNNDNMPIQLATEEYPLPILFRFGLAYRMDLSANYGLQVAASMNHPSNDKESVDMGVEANLYDVVYLRAGYRSLFGDQAEDGLTLGGGLAYTFVDVVTLKVDYAWSDWNILASVNRFTLGVEAAL